MNDLKEHIDYSYNVDTHAKMLLEIAGARVTEQTALRIIEQGGVGPLSILIPWNPEGPDPPEPPPPPVYPLECHCPDRIHLRDNAGAVVTTFTSFSNTAMENITFYLYDNLGNTRVTYYLRSCVSTVTVENILDYDPYGKVLRDFTNPSSDKERYVTTQHERDKETGYDYRGARFYDSDIARFLTTDPMGQYHSAYLYVGNNPIIFIDPDGMWAGEFLVDQESGKMKKISDKGDAEGIDYYHFANQNGDNWGSTLATMTVDNGRISSITSLSGSLSENTQSAINSTLDYLFATDIGRGLEAIWRGEAAIAKHAEMYAAAKERSKNRSIYEIDPAGLPYPMFDPVNILAGGLGMMGSMTARQSFVKTSFQFGKSRSGNTVFGFQARFPQYNLNLRLDRGFRAPYKNTTSTYLGKPYNGFNTHINIQKPGSFNYHLPLNFLKWKYYNIP